jgi:CRISPR/Cas system-associated endonuclease/helicase Cas3
MTTEKPNTLESLRKTKQKLDAAHAEVEEGGQGEDLSTADPKERRKKTFSLANESILAIERIRFEAARRGENLSASDVVNEAVMRLLKQKGLTL